MASFVVLRRVARDRVIVLVLIALALASCWFAFGGSSRGPARLRLSAGRPEGLRHMMAETLATSARERRVALTLVPSAGSDEALDLLQAGRIELALVQGGLDAGGRDEIR